MKKYLVIAVTCCSFTIGCSKVEPTAPALIISDTIHLPTPPNPPCETYRISNPQGPYGRPLLYEYMDCDGVYQKGYVNPQAAVIVTGRLGTVACVGGSISLY